MGYIIDALLQVHDDLGTGTFERDPETGKMRRVAGLDPMVARAKTATLKAAGDLILKEREATKPKPGEEGAPVPAMSLEDDLAADAPH
jgi:hypothetical protein